MHPVYRNAIGLAALGLFAPIFYLCVDWVISELFALLFSLGFSWMEEKMHPSLFAAALCILAGVCLYYWLEPLLNYFFER